MILIWRGWGILVLFIMMLAGLLAFLLMDALRPMGLSIHWVNAIGGASGSIAAGLAIWFFAKAMSGKVVRRLVDPATGRDVLIRRSAGSLFFIPTKYWAFIVVGAGVLMSTVQILQAEKVIAEPTQAYAPAQADTADQADTAQSQ